ncbi:hypothetical protein OFN60_32695, partial [Escherichia coli]|nr:hypothetical protein [Escherichia coli]
FPGTAARITDFAVQVADGRPEAYTRGVPSVPLLSNGTAGTAYSVNLLLTLSEYADRSYFTAASATVNNGYRASFVGFTATPAPASATDSLV